MHGRPGDAVAAAGGQVRRPVHLLHFNKERGIAPGLPSFEEMRQVFFYESIRADTAVFGVIGDPVGHSLSPLAHNVAFRKVGVNAVYVPFRVPSETLGQFLRNFERSARAGLQRHHPAQGGGGASGRRARPHGGHDEGGQHPAAAQRRTGGALGGVQHRLQRGRRVAAAQLQTAPQGSSTTLQSRPTLILLLAAWPAPSPSPCTGKGLCSRLSVAPPSAPASWPTS